MPESVLSSALNLAEEAVALVRSARALAWAIYAAGAVPFFGLLLFEATDIAQSPTAPETLLDVSLGLAICYVWMHICQAMYAAALFAQLTEAPFACDRATLFSAFSIQAAIQPAKLIAWPCALVLVIPHGIVTMFFQHALVAGSKPGIRIREAATRAATEAATKQGEGYAFLAIIFLLRVALWANLFVLLLVMPSLWHIFTGIDTSITRRPMLLLNPTSWVALLSLCYLGLDPVVKAGCVLRSLAGESRRSGLDLRIRLARVRSATVLLVMALCLGATTQTARATNLKGGGNPVTSPAAMRTAIDSVFRDPSLSWNLPVARKKPPPRNAIYAFIESAYDKATAAWQSMGRWIEGLEEHLHRWLTGIPKGDSRKKDVPEPWGVAPAVEGLAVLMGAAILVLLWRSRSRRRVQLEGWVPADFMAATVDGAELDSSTRKEDEWLALADEHAAKGNLRLALRGCYLASLAALSQAGLISVSKGKSNRDYLHEIQRRNRREPETVSDLMHANVRMFERVWYGKHDVNGDLYAAFARNVAEVRKCL